MQDRVSQYPGRVKLTPVSGQENVYDMEWADGATVAGTALNKANLLTDSTASSYRLGTSATPNSVFSKLKDALLLSGTSGTPKKPNGSSVTISASGISGIASAVFETGTYTGNGASSRTISLGFQASAVLLEDWIGLRVDGQYTVGGLALPNVPLVAKSATGNAIMEITSSGFQIKNSQSGSVGEKLNLSGVLYRYIAFR